MRDAVPETRRQDPSAVIVGLGAALPSPLHAQLHPRTRSLPGSPALDAASTPDCPTTDQRGVLRPQGAACDIGSYERE